MEESKKRRIYPTNEERVLMVEQKIARLEMLNAHRMALIQETEWIHEKRKAALGKSKAEYDSAVLHRDRLIAITNKRSKNMGVRAAKKAEKALFDEIKEKLALQGKTMDDLLNSL